MALQRITPQSTDRACFLLLGQAGIGKTSQIRCLLGQDCRNGKWTQTQLPPEKVLVLSAESGLLCVRDLVVSGAVEGFEIRSFEEFLEALRFCKSAEFREAGYQWIFLDSLTEIGARCVDSFQKKYPNRSDTIKMWGEYSASMTEMIKKFRDMAGVNVVFTCLLGTDKDDIGRVTVAPDIQGGGLKKRLASYFDEVLLLDHIEVQAEDGSTRKVRGFRTNATSAPGGLAKDRSGLLDEYERPNLLMVRNKIINR